MANKEKDDELGVAAYRGYSRTPMQQGQEWWYNSSNALPSQPTLPSTTSNIATTTTTTTTTAIPASDDDADNNYQQDKVFFSVLDVTDSRRYKVFLRPDDISRLKVSKIRKTLSSAAGKPPFSFDLWVGDEVLLDRDDARCAELGITPQTVLKMCPSGELPQKQVESKTGGKNSNFGEEEIASVAATVEPASVTSVLQQLTDAASEAPLAVELNERQRALQAQLYEEAKRSQVFSRAAGWSHSSSSSNNKNNADGGNDGGEVLPGHSAVGDVSDGSVMGGHTRGIDDGFTDFFEEILAKKTVPTSPSLPSPSGVDIKAVLLDTVAQGAHYYDTYSHAGAERGTTPPGMGPGGAHMISGEEDEEERVGELSRGGYITAGGERCSGSAPTCGREAELVELVEKLQDDVSDLLALHVRDETTKQALQQELASSQRRVWQLEKSEQQARQQLSALLAELQHARSENGESVFPEEQLRAALCNMGVAYHNELLLRENAALERRLAQELRRRLDMALILEDMKGHIRVLVRVRPPLRILRERHIIVEEAVGGVSSRADEARMVADGQRNTVTITEPYTGARQFNFYRVFAESATQKEVFSEVAPLVQLACEGVNVSVLAYGQTGSGKTYTILGQEEEEEEKEKQQQQQGTSSLTRDDADKNNNSSKINGNDNNTGVRHHSNNNDNSKEAPNEEEELEADDDGIVPRTIRVLFQHLRAEAAAEAATLSPGDGEASASMFEVSCSLLEMYNDKVHDLLAPPQVVVPTFYVGGANTAEPRGPACVAPQRSVKIGQDGRMYVVGLTQCVVRDACDAVRVLREGASRRQVHATQQNATSSRSHLIFTIHLAQRRRSVVQRGGGRTATASVAYRRLESKLVFVDLAGSERIAKSQSVGDRLLEARHINKSLSALGDVVATLSTAASAAVGAGMTHVPYRNSMLTGLLQDVIGSRSKTVLVACVAPSDPPYENNTAETMTTLQFASRVRCVRNFAPPLPVTAAAAAAGAGGGATTKGPAAQCTEADTGAQRTTCPVGRGVAKLWMRPTESSKSRAGAAGRQNAGGVVTINDPERTGENKRAQSPVPPQQQQRGNDGNTEQKPRMRF
ncbi:hypothetical protein DQ04_06641010 [Trypanosoma grayi]|uniref:hypothetical protein n=1 Tax=Trypanosoma grayi TaxID=71804 RepID=UPI0004F47F8C|nr:hypothetical protein DQ04_06641010 [Trypanosoma grayi]KEG08688.1 hypothetical protein DQ04_06641010 [Trypanosoma grayi]